MKLTRFLLAGLTVGFTCLASAQTSTPGPRQGGGFRGPGPHGPGPHFPPPVIAALDLNKDGTISADEIAQAATSLKALDKNGDGKLDFEELHPGRPADAPTPPAGAVRARRNPVMLALDANGDGELSAAEIANAPTSLKALDTNKDGQLTPDELRPLPPTQ